MWSIPTRRKPIPRSTASVYFTFEVSKIKPEVSVLKSCKSCHYFFIELLYGFLSVNSQDFPVNVYYVFETHRLVHRFVNHELKYFIVIWTCICCCFQAWQESFPREVVERYNWVQSLSHARDRFLGQVGQTWFQKEPSVRLHFLWSSNLLKLFETLSVFRCACKYIIFVALFC